MNPILDIADSIDISELRRAMKVAAIRSDTVTSALEKSRALQTLVILLRFSDYLQVDHVEVGSRITPNSSEDNPLQDAITRSGIGYFGPMFKKAATETAMLDKSTILSIFNNNGFDTEPLNILDGTQLDMLLTKTKETGLIDPQSV